MIDKIAYELVKAVAAAINFDDKWAGLVRPLQKKVQNADKIFPVAINTPATCDQNDYTALVPDSTKKSIMYIEKKGNQEVTLDRKSYQYVTVPLQLVLWYNLDLITKGEYISEDVLADKILEVLPNKLSDSLFNGVKQVRIFPTAITYGSEVVSQYTYNEIKTQFCMLPYGFLAIDIEVTYISTHCQRDLTISTGCVTGVGNHETY